MKVLVTGGVKSGKSRFAEERILQLVKEGEVPVYLATTEFRDPELEARIQAHQQRRAGKFFTVEEPWSLAGVLKPHAAPVLVECLTMWLNNGMHHRRSEEEIFRELDRVLVLPNPTVFVLNEVGLGVMPENELARRFIDLSGRIGQQLGAACDEVWWCVAGHPVSIKSIHSPPAAPRAGELG